ncbi:LuxR C-terminal-related transcriptional regulator [Chelatococcus asaccharovorans]|uniref:LuxR C-terminal-related transcriptional regulator n=1 Tax=Chelatococcus asaccharovorans TaxID=28210 RepID=UPI00224C65A2|nr:LuxR C-terminal-related transcriptional regulator [Chelatococcus asaccharovorans]CAH1660444.1 LuxR family maltose regulon positive regulatory protein [Chelatococcus asaccharovorans]CAH1683801.1 LuxR family maltose regulon positive regulatory protein [Chelatococcus asaccharovorans]
MEPIRTKLVPPLETAGLLDRPRLRQLLVSASARRITLVKAPAGYGKTTLLAQWHEALSRQGARVAWLTLDRQERSGKALAASLAAMLAANGMADGLDSIFRNETYFNAEGLLAAVIDRLSALAAPVFIVLDDTHVLADDAADMLGLLLRRAPANTRFVIATRETAALELGVLRAYGQLCEIGMQALQFTRDETCALLAGAGHGDLSPEDIDTLMERTEGWVTGLKLASLALDGCADRSAQLAAFSGRRRAVADFFAEDVFAIQNEDIRAFLLATAHLDRLSPPLCDAVAGRSDSAAMLRRLEEIGLFIAALDDEGNWYRYHSLFSDFLRRKLADVDPGAEPCLQRAAAEWLSCNGHWAEALEHALRARDFERLGRYLEAIAEEFTYTGRLGVVARYAGHLPVAIFAQCPWTMVSVAWLKIRAMRHAESRRLLDQARLCLDQRLATGDDGSSEALRHAIEHREMMLAAAHDDAAQVEQRCHRLMRYFDGRRPYLACTIYGQLLIARREQFRFDGLDKIHADGKATAEQSGYSFALISLQAAAGASLFANGRTEAATAALENGFAESLQWTGRNSGLSALVALPLAEVAYETNAVERAAELIDSYLPVAREMSFPDQLVSGHIVASRLLAAKGDLAGARRALDEASAIALECDLERLRLAVIHEQIRLLLRNGMPEAASRLLEWAGLPVELESCLPRSGATTREETHAEIWVRMALSYDDIPEALAIIKQWRSFCAQRGAVRLHVRWSILMAQALLLGGEVRAAQRQMREAIATAAPAGLVRCFVDEGTVVRSILSEAYADSIASDHPTDLFAQRVLAAFEGKRPMLGALAAPDEGLYGRLSGKELEILTLVGCGMRNREIGNRLGLSEGSVKWYMQQVYDKVGIRRRSQAVERARQFGLIA